MTTLPRTPSFRLDGRRALVTGAGRGIGLAAAARLVALGLTRARQFTWQDCAARTLQALGALR